MYVHTYVRTTGQSVQLTQVWRARALSDMFFISPARCKRFIEIFAGLISWPMWPGVLLHRPKVLRCTRTKIIRQRSSRNSIINRDTAEGKSYGGNNSSSKQSLHAPRHLTQQCSGRQVGNARASRQILQRCRCLDL